MLPKNSNPSPEGQSTERARPTDLLDYERRAPAHMSTMAWEYIDCGAADEVTLRWNRQAFDRWGLHSAPLPNEVAIDLTCRLAGRDLPFPILLAPTAYHRLLHPEGEMETARGAGTAGALMVVSTTATVSLEDIARAATGPLWFQLYVQRDREETRALIHRAEAAGYQALVLTVDAPVLGPRYREVRSNFALPPGLRRANLTGEAASGAQRRSGDSIYSAQLDASVTWKDIDWLRSQSRLPLFLKGILNPDDAVRAVDKGVAGIIVSNHGGRNLDSLPATLEPLPKVVEAVAGRTTVLMDGGVRRGTDVLKALALGASAVLIGRPYLHGLAMDGARGVAHVIELLRHELAHAMRSAGVKSVRAVPGSILREVAKTV